MALKLDAKSHVTVDALVAEFDGKTIGVKPIATVKYGSANKRTTKRVRDNLRDPKRFPEYADSMAALEDGERMDWSWKIDSNDLSSAEEYVTIFNRIMDGSSGGGKTKPVFKAQPKKTR